MGTIWSFDPANLCSASASISTFSFILFVTLFALCIAMLFTLYIMAADAKHFMKPARVESKKKGISYIHWQDPNATETACNTERRVFSRRYRLLAKIIQLTEKLIHPSIDFMRRINKMYALIMIMLLIVLVQSLACVTVAIYKHWTFYGVTGKIRTVVASVARGVVEFLKWAQVQPIHGSA